MHYWSLKDEPIGLITESTVQSRIEEEIKNTKAQLVVFDNLITLASSAMNAGKWTLLTDWFSKIYRAYNVAVLYIHHLGKDGTPLGAVNIQATTRNTINIGKLPPKENEAGCRMNFQFTKIQGYPELLNKESTYFLPSSPTAPQGYQWIKEEPEGISTDSISKQASPAYIYDDALSERENKILHLLHKKTSIDREDVQTELKCSRATAQNSLKNLCDQGKIEKIGSARATRYELKKY